MDRDNILEILRTTPGRLAELSAIKPQLVTTRPTEAEWSIAEVVAHLVLEEERVMLPRFRRLASEDSPVFPTTRGLVDHPNPREFGDELTSFRHLRQQTLAVLDGISEADWRRVGTSPTRGSLTVEGWADYLARHDLEHLEQINSILAAPGALDLTLPDEAKVKVMTRAVVLGSGAALGRSWEIGMLKGLRDGGVDLTAADLLVGSSAGAIVSAQIRAGRSIDDLYAVLLEPPAPTSPDNDSRGRNERSAEDTRYFQDTLRMWSGAAEDVAVRIEMGKRALATPHPISDDVQRANMRTRLGVDTWPSASLKIAAVDISDGSVRFFDSTQGVPIETALAASAAQPGLQAPVAVGANRYMDGGVAGTNIDGAAGYDVVIGITPFTARTKTSQEMDVVRASGGQVIDIAADDESRKVMGSNLADRSRARASAEAGLRQAVTAATVLRDLWNRGSY